MQDITYNGTRGLFGCAYITQIRSAANHNFLLHASIIDQTCVSITIHTAPNFHVYLYTEVLSP